MKTRFAGLAASVFVFGIGVGYAAQKIDFAAYHGKSKQDAAKALLQVALIQAKDGSWERIAVGRIYYLSGVRPEGQALFESVRAKKPKSSDLFRIARVYREGGEWDKAKVLFDQYVQAIPEDEKELAQVGASPHERRSRDG